VVGLDINDAEQSHHVLTLLVTYKKLQQATPQINQLVEVDLRTVEIYWICMELPMQCLLPRY
jgi:hypothetical protein